MFFIALIPPLFRKVMDPRVIEWANGDIDKIQIDAAHKNAIVRKYGTPALSG